ncbi:YhcH/YjgK/YiaL family protein [Streptococcus parauberis]|uniref:YhcH/YjgK/YiaL family protein n=2 Tax=Streptococcus parauberis TaxID=1348 RepID=A0A0E2UAI6_9STRE|nr:YhcH/YjgK/YiaL family protein [Streptococcus parauberis]AUT04967.1 hypothetical protein SPSF3K_00226 [Streptococcus parauberis]KYP18033.1 Toxin-antitoxin biofilm protein TabA [Streptococcus parauberis]KYP19095.1 Toxin-antitoxin biofilm protein TabA [Streptococcus parauberis]KYP19691.1 Toxin-antitoxin biofilm protein TabA [Streptococcus parauberis]KYP23337.1 Toxin-antitoxin biofilm protein TabA [Streptococcus parauberis]
MMIFDQLSNLAQYKGIHPELDNAIDYLNKDDYKTLQVGSHHIKGDEIILHVSETDLNDVDQSVYEYHETYADIHLLLVGQETLSYGYGKTDEIASFKNDDDFGLVTCQQSCSMGLGIDSFAIFFPKESHQPGQQLGNDKHIKKVVVKVLMN